MGMDWQAMTQALIEDIRTNGGNVTSGPFAGRQVLLLTTTGARTGTSRTTPLVFSREGGQYVIGASKNGAPTHPAWYHNLLKSPIVKVEADGDTFQARATVVSPEERRRLYDQHAELHTTFQDYEARTERVIPIITLERLADPS